MMQRYNIETSIGQDWEEVRSDDGEYVRYDEAIAALAAAERLVEAVREVVQLIVKPTHGSDIPSVCIVTPADFPTIKDALTAYTQTKETL